MSWKQLPADLRESFRKALEACRFSCGELGILFPESEPRITLADARKVVEIETELQRQILEAAKFEQRILLDRLATDARIGIRIPSNKAAQKEAKLKAEYPGWPDGYRFVKIDNGKEIRVGAWRVEGDDVLEALQRDEEALRGDYARAVRSSYRRYLQF